MLVGVYICPQTDTVAAAFGSFALLTRPLPLKIPTRERHSGLQIIEKVAPKVLAGVKCGTREGKTLDHCRKTSSDANYQPLLLYNQ